MSDEQPTFTVSDFINDMQKEAKHIRKVFEDAIDKINKKEEKKDEQ